MTEQSPIPSAETCDGAAEKPPTVASSDIGDTNMASTEMADDVALSIGDLARELDVTTRAVRFYEARGLIRPDRVAGARIYRRRDRARLLLILRGKRLGYSLDEIREYLDLYDADPTQITQVTHLLTKVEATMSELAAKHAAIETTLRELNDLKDLCLRQLSDAQQAAE